MTSHITNAGVLHKIDGIEYEFSPLTLEDLEWLEMWLKTRIIEAGSAAVQSVSQSQGDRILRMAAVEAAEIDVFGGDFAKLLSPAGVSRMLYRMTVKSHPEVTIEMCRDWISTREKAEAIHKKLDLIKAGSRSKEDADSNGTPLRAPRHRAKKTKRRR